MKFDFKQMSSTELNQQILDILSEIADVKSQLESARTCAEEGHPYDETWFKRAKDALHAKGRAVSRLQAELGNRRREEHRQRSLRFERVFVELAQIKLAPELFTALVEEARASCEQSPQLSSKV